MTIVAWNIACQFVARRCAGADWIRANDTAIVGNWAMVFGSATFSTVQIKLLYYDYIVAWFDRWVKIAGAVSHNISVLYC